MKYVSMVEYTQGELRGAQPLAGKPTATAQRPLSAASSDTRHISARTRGAITREATYFRAEHRAFAPGNGLADWFAAEYEIEALLAQRHGSAVTGWQDIRILRRRFI